MFTIDQIKEAHSKVKSGADFPAYVRALKELGVVHYETFVNNGHTDYFGFYDYTASSDGMYPDLVISAFTNAAQFKNDLKAHQQGKTDYMTFCNDCAKSGILKWVVSIEKMTCTYYDLEHNEVLVEIIPGE